MTDTNTTRVPLFNTVTVEYPKPKIEGRAVRYLPGTREDFQVGPNDRLDLFVSTFNGTQRLEVTFQRLGQPEGTPREERVLLDLVVENATVSTIRAAEMVWYGFVTEQGEQGPVTRHVRLTFSHLAPVSAR